MAGGTYAALSGLRTRLEQLDRLAGDIANAKTAGYKAESNVIEVYVTRLRRKLGADLIETRRGQGYVLATSADDRSS